MDPKTAAALAYTVEQASREFKRQIAQRDAVTEGSMAVAIAEHVAAQIQLFAGCLRVELARAAE